MRPRKQLPLTETQQRVLDYLKSDEPIISNAYMCYRLNIDHAQKLNNILAQLVLKGLLAPTEDAEVQQ